MRTFSAHSLFLSRTSILSCAAALAIGVGCGASDPDDGVGPDGGLTDGMNPGTGGTGDGTGGGIDLGSGGGATDDEREVECRIDEETGMEVCSCVKVASWGALGNFGAVPGMDGQDAIVAWLNQNSTGEAEYFATKPPITTESLASFHVIIIQDVSAWAAFTAEEKAAFEAWVREGGGVMSLNGYLEDANEMANVNDLLAFTGMSYIPASDTSNEAERMTQLGKCHYCYGAAVPQAGWTEHPIGANMKFVGAFHGRAVTPGDATIVAQENGNVLGAAAQYDEGYVFMFHDEWVTYNSQWTGVGLMDDCRIENDHDMECWTEHPTLKYSLPQFWYNSLQWVSGSPTCFDINDETIIK